MPQKQNDPAQELAYLQEIISLLPGHVYWQDKDSNFLGCNILQAQAAGLKDWRDIIGTTPRDYLDKEQAEFIITNNNEVMHSGKPKLVEETATFADGMERVFLSHKLPLRNKLGEIIGLLGVSLDITQQKNLEHELSLARQRAERAEATLESILALMPGHVYWKDKEGRYLGANELQAKSSGFASRRDIVGVDDYAIIPKEHADKVRAIDCQVMQTGKAIVAEESVELPGRVMKTFLSHKGPLYDSNHNIIGIQGVSLDITERKQLEQELYLTKQQTQTALEHIIGLMPGHVFWRDREGRFLGSNNKAKELGLIAGKELIGKTLYDLFPSEQADVFLAVDREVMETGIPQTIEEQLVHPNGEVHTYLTQKVPLHDEDDKIIGILGIAADITERKKNEIELADAKRKAEIANQIKTDFLANMSHDLRTPLNGIIGFASILQMRPHYPEQVEYIEGVHKCGMMLLQLIEDILDYAKLEADKFALSFTVFNLREVVNDLTAMLGQQSAAKGIQLTIDYAEAYPSLVNNDEKVIRRILQNLLNNAVKFTNEGEVKLTLKFLKTAHSQKQLLEIMVEDTGIGIPADKLSSIFDRFSRIEPAYRGRYHGLGLGLTIVKEFIEKLNGTIEVQSTEGKGTIFVCRTPVEVAEMMNEALTKKQA